MTTFYIKYSWTKKNHSKWIINGLQAYDHINETPEKGPYEIYPGMNSECTGLKSLTEGIYNELYDLYQVDSRIQEGDEFLLQPVKTKNWDGVIKVRVPKQLRFYTESFHILCGKRAEKIMRS